MKKNIVKIFVTMIILGLLLLPSIDAALSRENKEIEVTENNEEPTCFGTIFGFTHTKYAWTFVPVSFAKVEAGKLKTISGIRGNYLLTGLPLGKTITVKGSKKGYSNYTTEITLTLEEPIKNLNMPIQPRDEDIKSSRNKQNNNVEPSGFGFGFIYGRIGTQMWSGWSSVYKVKIDAGIRKKICGGHYILCFLPLDRTYTITASKDGWETVTQEVTLTKSNRIERADFTINPDEDYHVEELSSNTESEGPECIGKIYGYTHCSHGVWTWDPIPKAIVRAGLKITKSDDEGYYEITGLKINRTYRVVAIRFGYLRTVEKVTLTAEKPEKKLYIDMMSFIDFIFGLF